MIVPAYNTTDRPVLIDPAGRQLGGGEWGAVDSTNDEVRTGVDLGMLVLKTVDELLVADVVPEARDAAERARTLDDRRRVFADAGAEDVRTAAIRAGLDLEADMVDDDGRPAPRRARTKAELAADLLYVAGDAEELLSSAPAVEEGTAPVGDVADDASPPPANETATQRKARERREREEAAAAPTVPHTPEG